MKKLPVFIILVTMIFVVITACSLPAFRNPVEPDPNSLSTAVAETEQFAQTQDAFSTLVAQATAVAEGTLTFPTATLSASSTATATEGVVPGTGQETLAPSQTSIVPTAVPTLTPFPTLTAVPTLTSVPTLARTSTPVTSITTVPPAPTIRAEFVADVTVPDGLKFYPNEIFTKVWRLKNTGTATWTTAYDIVFNNGDQMSAPGELNLPKEVKPGQTVDIVVDMKAPGSVGSYAGSWLLRTSSGTKFGLGGSTPFTAEIEVIKRPDFGSDVVMNFVVNYCLATFINSDGNEIYCPGPTSSAASAVYRLLTPRLEGDRVDDEPALIMLPNAKDDGYLRGSYPEFDVKNGDTFMAVIGCLEGATNCNVKMQLIARVGTTSTVMETWTEKEDDKFHSVSVDLSSLAGKKVTFMLRVLANGDPRDDKAFWLVPRIVRGTPNTAPVLNTIGPKTINEGSQLTFTATAFDAEGNALTYSLPTKPAGASITPAGVFTWTPTEAQGPGTYTIRVQVSDGALTDFEDVVVTVNEVNNPPVLSAIGAKTVNEGNLLTFTATAIDPEGQPITFALQGEPTGASITPAGVFTWTPTAAQGPNVYTIRVIANDGLLADFEDITITVTETNTAPVLDAIGPKSVDEGAALTFTASATDAQGHTLTYSLGAGAPAGASIDPSSGVFTWTPTEAQGGAAYTVRISVTDSLLSDFEDVAITVSEVNQAPVLTSPGDQSSAEGAVIDLAITATDADLPANTLVYSAPVLPAGLSINSSTGRIAGTIAVGAATASPYNVIITVSDGVDMDDISFVWTVSTP